MTIGKPMLSIVTGTFNSMKHIKATQESVLASEFQDIEWIIVDDGSRDGTREYLSTIDDSRVRLHLKDVNKGIGDSYSLGVSLAKGKYLQILDHDDTIPSGSLLKRIEALEANPTCQMAFGIAAYMDESGHIYHQSKFPFAKNSGVMSCWRIMFGVFLSPTYPLKQGGVVIRTDFAKANPNAFDIELFLRAAVAGCSVFISEPCLNYRTFRNQFSSSRKMRVIKFFHFYWAKYAIRYLPWYLSPVIAVYRTVIEFLKVVWSLVSPSRI